MRSNELGKQKLGRVRSLQLAKHAKLQWDYPWRKQGRGTILKPLSSQQREY